MDFQPKDIIGCCLLLIAVAINISPRFIKGKAYVIYAKIGALIVAIAGALLIF